MTHEVVHNLGRVLVGFGCPVLVRKAKSQVLTREIAHITEHTKCSTDHEEVVKVGDASLFEC